MCVLALTLFADSSFAGTIRFLFQTCCFPGAQWTFSLSRGWLVGKLAPACAGSVRGKSEGMDAVGIQPELTCSPPCSPLAVLGTDECLRTQRHRKEFAEEILNSSGQPLA